MLTDFQDFSKILRTFWYFLASWWALGRLLSALWHPKPKKSYKSSAQRPPCRVLTPLGDLSFLQKFNKKLILGALWGSTLATRVFFMKFGARRHLQTPKVTLNPWRVVQKQAFGNLSPDSLASAASPETVSATAAATLISTCAWGQDDLS